MNTNKIIGRAVAKAVGMPFLTCKCECGFAGFLKFGFEGCQHCGGITYPNYDSDRNAIAHAREVLLDTDEKRDKFYDECIDLLPKHVSKTGWSHVRLYDLIDLSPADQADALIEALDLTE